MKYTPEELYARCENSGQLNTLVLAYHHNKYGFHHISIGKRLVERKDGIYARVTMPDKTTREVPVPAAPGEAEKVLREKLPYALVECLIYKKFHSVLFVSGSKGDTKGDLGKEMWRKILIEFLRACEINTPGKFAKLMKEGERLMEELQHPEKLPGVTK